MEIQINTSRHKSSVFSRRLTILSGTNLALTPLVDVIFLLLIFFMISSSLVFQPGITVNLPETKLEFKSVADKFIITLTKEKLLFFNDLRLDNWDQLKKKLSEVAWNPNTPNDNFKSPIIILKADKDVFYNEVVKIMSISRSYGLNVFLVMKSKGIN